MTTTSYIEIQVLGELSVRIDGEVRPLPRSRKTRALLAYLAVTGREHRRDRLCELLWDVVHDPRAALRWSLSKLRKVLGPAAPGCLLASRDRVQLAFGEDGVDVHRLRRSSREGFTSQPTAALLQLADSCRGPLLEGLLLPDFDAFEAWLEAERGDVRRMHGQLRRVLVDRLQDDVDQALVHARAWFQQSGEPEAQEWIQRLTTRSAPARLQSSEASPGEARERSTSAVGSRSAGPARALIGRDAEIARLCLTADEARTQHTGRVVLLIGEPGMGKTRLLEELLHRVRDHQPHVVHAAFYEAEQNRPLAPFLDATRGALDRTANEDDGVPDREQIFDDISILIRRGSEQAGLGLLLLDDAHLCDSSSCELLHYLVRTAARSPLLTVLACRPAELDDNSELSTALVGLRRRKMVEEIRLGPLDVGSVRALIAAESQRDSNGPEDGLIRGSQGNPLIALELARATGADDSVPRTLSDLVMARLSSLDEGTAALVRWAAVLEHGSLQALARACSNEVEGFVAALEQAMRYHFIDVGDDSRAGHYSMSHALIQRVVYESISPVRRSAMHTVLAELLGEDPDSAELSSVVTYHATRADRPDLAARALVAGARGCAALGAVDEAAKLADAALELLPGLQPAAAIAAELEALLVLAQVRKPRDSALFITRLTELGMASLDRDRADLAHSAFQAASNLRWEAGDGGEGYGLARQAWQASRAGTPSERVRSSSFMAMCLVMLEKQLPDAQAIVHEAEAVTRAEQSMAEPVELGLARGLLHLHAGRLDEARRDAADSRTLAKLAKGALFEALSLQLRLQLEYAAGQYDDCRQAAEDLAALAPQIREGGEGALAAAALALAADELGTGRTALIAATDQLAGLDDKRRLAWVANRWAHRERIEGDVCEARRLAELALEASLTVEAMSEAAMAACELLAIAMLDASTPLYAEAENTLAEIEARTALSFEARRLIEEVTS